MKNKVVFILGPTASGKTGVAVKVAKKLLTQGIKSEIISADSRQVFKKLDVGSGKDLKEYGETRYNLIDICEPGDNFTLYDWLKLAREKLDKMFENKIVPIVVGGTGLYAKALAEGFVLEKQGNESSGKYSRDDLNQLSLVELENIIKKLGISSSRIDLKNPRRIIRAIENFQDGILISKKEPEFKKLIIALNRPRKELYDKIDKRVEERFAKEKMLEEVENLIDDGVDTSWLMSLGLEYRIITIYILAQRSGYKKKNIEEVIQKYNYHCEDFQTLESMKQMLKFKIHAYARRQIIWLNKQEGLIWTDKENALSLVENFLEN